MTPTEPDDRTVTLRTEDVRGLAAALHADTTDFTTAAAQAAERFSVGGHQEGTHRDDRPWAADPRNAPAQTIVEFHTEAMEEGVRQLTDLATGMSYLSVITARISHELTTQDDLNAVDLTRLRRLIGRDDRPPTRPDSVA